MVFAGHTALLNKHPVTNTNSSAANTQNIFIRSISWVMRNVSWVWSQDHQSPWLLCCYCFSKSQHTSTIHIWWLDRPWTASSIHGKTPEEVYKLHLARIYRAEACCPFVWVTETTRPRQALSPFWCIFYVLLWAYLNFLHTVFYH